MSFWNFPKYSHPNQIHIHPMHKSIKLALWEAKMLESKIEKRRDDASVRSVCVWEQAVGVTSKTGLRGGIG